jgi:thioredoxin-related protein
MTITLKTLARVMFALALAAVTLVSCTSVESVSPIWLTDYDTAQKTAALEEKNIFLLFSRDAENETSAELRKNVFEDAALLNGLAKGFVAVNLDFAEARYDAADKAGEGSAEENQLIRDIDVANKYGVQVTPIVYLLTKEGYVIDTVEIDETVTTAQGLLTLADAKATRVAEFVSLVKTVQTTDGLDKVRAIDALCEITENNYRPILGIVFREVPALDPKDETGLVGKYLLQIAFLDAIDAFSIGDMEKGFSAFRNVSTHLFLSPDQKQEALLFLAIFKGETGSSMAEVVTYLKEALAASPQSDKATEIGQLITGLSTPVGK